MKGGAVVLCLASACLCFGCSSGVYSYKVIDGGCDCETYIVRETSEEVEYSFRGTFTEGDGIVTSLDVRFTNKGKDTLFLDGGSVKISSRNITYQYNDKFLPLPPMIIPPGSTDHLLMDGTEVEVHAKGWERLAGERLSISLSGIRYGKKVLDDRTVTMVPENPAFK